MSEQPFVKTIRQLLEETKGLDDAKPARKAGAARPSASAPARPAPLAAGDDDPDMALLDEIEAGLEDDLEEGLEEPGETAAPAPAEAAASEDDDRPGRRLRRRRAGARAGAAAGAGAEADGERRPLARFLQFLGNLQERRADTMARGRRPARMISPSLMREASGQAVDPGDPVAERRRKQIQEFRAAWVESLNLKPASQAAALKPIGGAGTATAAPDAAAATAATPTPTPTTDPTAAPAATTAPAASAPAPAKGKKGGDRTS
ncbi:MAG TPA: hypothetical protein VMQ62_04795 [Dongiaceae bacterium]|nr:hypothetical protein [Dongiaceae bacterium]